jgi:hypothetical protein
MQIMPLLSNMGLQSYAQGSIRVELVSGQAEFPRLCIRLSSVLPLSAANTVVR